MILKRTGTALMVVLISLTFSWGQDATVSEGTRIHVRLDDQLHSGQTQQGETFTMTVDEPVAAGDRVVIPKGTIVTGTVAEVEEAERPQKPGKLVLHPEQLQLHGDRVEFEGEITAEGRKLEGRGSSEEDLKNIGIGAGIGALAGVILDGGKGAVIGALIGGGGTFIATKGEQLVLPEETRLVILVQEPFRVPTR